MTNCAHCGHDLYWHEARRPDEPARFAPSLCMLCGCDTQLPPSEDTPANA